MKPTEWIGEYGAYQDIDSLQNCLDNYIAKNEATYNAARQTFPEGSDPDTSMSGWQFINEYETETRIAREVISRWQKEEKELKRITPSK